MKKKLLILLSACSLSIGVASILAATSNRSVFSTKATNFDGSVTINSTNFIRTLDQQNLAFEVSNIGTGTGYLHFDIGRNPDIPNSHNYEEKSGTIGSFGYATSMYIRFGASTIFKSIKMIYSTEGSAQLPELNIGSDKYSLEGSIEMILNGDLGVQTDTARIDFSEDDYSQKAFVTAMVIKYSC